MTGKKRVLVLCTGNSCRSQMAEGFLRSFGPEVEAFSAGTYPAERTHPNAVRVMREAGVDISASYPKSVDRFRGQSFDAVVTVCNDADASCPAFSGAVTRRLHLPFRDPARAVGSDEDTLEIFRSVRDQIRDRFQTLYEELTGKK